MDPKQQSSRPQQQTPYISDFVSAPPPSKVAPRGDLNTPMPVNTPMPATTATMTNAPQQQQPISNTTATPQQQPARSSFAVPKPPEIEPRDKNDSKPHQGLRDLLSVFGVLASALLLAICLIAFVFQSYQVDGPSMQTTLHDNDHLIVWKVPRTIAKFTGKHYIPNRGDVIVFNEPGGALGGTDKQLIKRVLALPGERITVKDGVVTVYNQDYPNGFNPDKSLPYGSVIQDTPGNVDVTIKEGQVFACGDNRVNSMDSRFFGPINADQIVGKLIIRILPLNSVKKF